jgi:hypothetical protein
MFRKPLSVESVAEFLSALRKSLRWRADREKIEEIAAEAEAHLSDRIEALTGQGMEKSRAEQAALAGFGRPHEFAAAVADGVIDTRLAQVARIFVQVGTVALCGGMLGLFAETSAGKYVPFVVAAFTLFTLPVAAFLGRRPQTRALALCLGTTAILGAVLSGIQIAPVQDGLSWRTLAQPFGSHDYLHGIGLLRRDYSRELAAERRWRDRLLKEQALVQLAKATYATPGAPVPARLRVGDGYLVPAQYDDVQGDGRGFIFHKELTNSQVKELIRKGEGRGFDHDAVMSKQPLIHVYNYDLALRTWQSHLARLESGLAGNLARRTVMIEQYRRAMEEPWRFNATAAVSYLWISVVYGLFFLGMDIALSLLGRLAYLMVRNRRRGPNPTTAG